jgi:hypothetical protein
VSLACGCLGATLGRGGDHGLQLLLLVTVVFCTVTTLSANGPDEYLGLYSQATALAVTLLARSSQFIRMRRSVVYGQLPEFATAVPGEG